MIARPRPPASVLVAARYRVSRACLLARPRGPLAGLDLADGSAVLLTSAGPGAPWRAEPQAALAAPPALVALLEPRPERAAALRRSLRLPGAARRARAIGAVAAVCAGSYLVALIVPLGGADQPAASARPSAAVAATPLPAPAPAVATSRPASRPASAGVASRAAARPRSMRGGHAVAIPVPVVRQPPAARAARAPPPSAGPVRASPRRSAEQPPVVAAAPALAPAPALAVAPGLPPPRAS